MTEQEPRGGADTPPSEEPRDADGETLADDVAARGSDDDDSPVERYRDSPGAGVLDPTDDVPEPNEPG